MSGQPNLQIGPEPTLEPDQDHQSHGGDSDYESGDNSETFSVCSSLHEYIEQNGRRYHTYWGPEKNPMPSDSVEQERLNILHECTLVISGNRTHYAPVDEIAHRVLDLGTGTGVWAIDYAQNHPHAEVLGIDISPIQPAWVPTNCTFEIDDFEAEWNYKRPFDFIMARTIAQSVTDWTKLLSQAKTHLRSGGWIEIGEYSLIMNCDDGTMPPDWPPAIALDLIQKAMSKLGREFPDGQQLKRKLETAGFVDVKVKTLKLPMGPWPKDPRLKQAGSLSLAASSSGYEAYGLHLLTNVLGMSNEEATDICTKAKAFHNQDRKVHAYMHYYSVCGRKPE